MTKRFTAVMMCALAVSSAVPAVPTYARNRTYASGSHSSNEKRMRDVAEQVQKAFDKQDLDKLADLCSYPVVISFAGGTGMEVQNKQEFIALGQGTIFTQAMRDAIASVNVARLQDGDHAGAQMGGDSGLNLYKFNGYWKINQIYQ